MRRSAGYPPALLEIADPPSVLYVRGNPDLLHRRGIAVVGSRNATPQGIQTAESFARHLAAQGLCIVSGLALGIDAAAHRGALAAQGETVAVIGTGADRIYPARNKELAIAIAERGAIVSEFPLGTPAVAYNFPRRNRIISGLARGVLVVEAAPESGSLITARLAADYTLPVGVDDSVGFGGDVRLVGQQFLSVDNRRPALWEPGYTILNAYVRYDAPKWYVMGQVRNATNAVYKTDAQEFSSVSNIQTAYWGDPRTFLGTVGFRF